VTIRSLTNQQVFDNAWKHFVTGGVAPWGVVTKGNSGTKCYYRAPETGAPCTIGVSIPDELYRGDYDDYSTDDPLDIGTLINSEPELQELFGDVSIELLEQLQSAHDDVVLEASRDDDLDAVDTIEKKLRLIAQAYHLEILL